MPPLFTQTFYPYLDTFENYKLSDKDDDASPNYYGYVNRKGEWFIMEETISPGADTYRFAVGKSDYTTNWNDRTNLTYKYFYEVF